MFSLHLSDEQATLNFGAALARLLRPGMTIFLRGDLGAGKTTLVRGVLRALGFEGRVKSPTYTLVESYTVSSLYLYHFDLYRFKHEQEWTEAGFDELIGGANICFIEWPERGGDLLPHADMTITLNIERDGRRVNIESDKIDLQPLNTNGVTSS